MSMTWEELRLKINAMTDEQLVSNVTAHLHSSDEYYPVDHFELVNDNEEDRLDDGHPFLVVLDTLAGDASSAGVSDLADPTTQCVLSLIDPVTDDRQRVEVAIANNSGLLEINLPGYGLREMDDTYGQIVCLEHYDGKLRLLVWADINDENATHTIDLVGARLSNRKEE